MQLLVNKLYRKALTPDAFCSKCYFMSNDKKDYENGHVKPGSDGQVCDYEVDLSVRLHPDELRQILKLAEAYLDS